jgi:hypothetical protein
LQTVEGAARDLYSEKSGMRRREIIYQKNNGLGPFFY